MTIQKTMRKNANTYAEKLKQRITTKFVDNNLYPDRTVDLLAYVDSRIPYFIEAYCLDLEENSNRHTHMAIGNLYAGKRRQTKNITLQTENWMHSELVDIISADTNSSEQFRVQSLYHILRDALDYQTYEDSYSSLEKIVLNRTSYSQFENSEIDQVKLSKILAATNGLTPSLSNNYHYRVDVLPSNVKEKMWPHMHSYFDGCPAEVKDAFERDHTTHSIAEWKAAGVCFNTQFDAPLVLAYSIPTPIDDSPKHWTVGEFPTSRDATMIALGTNMWNAICTVEELGLNSCCLRAYNTDKISNIVSVSSDEQLPEGWKWEPFIFLCVGKGTVAKGDHRKYKPKGIVNTLDFDVA